MTDSIWDYISDEDKKHGAGKVLYQIKVGDLHVLIKRAEDLSVKAIVKSSNINKQSVYFQDLTEEAKEEVQNNVSNYLLQSGDIDPDEEDLIDEFVDDFINRHNDHKSINVMLHNPDQIDKIASQKKVAQEDPSDEEVQEKAWEMFGTHWNALSTKEQDEIYKALGYEVEGTLTEIEPTSSQKEVFDKVSEPTNNLGQALSGAQIVDYDENSGLTFAWFGGHGVHAYDEYGREVDFWNAGDSSQQDASPEDVQESIEEKKQEIIEEYGLEASQKKTFDLESDLGLLYVDETDEIIDEEGTNYSLDDIADMVIEKYLEKK